MNRYATVCLCVGILGIATSGLTEDGALLGFSAERSREQQALEDRFDASLDATNLEQWMKRLSARPHHVGSDWGKQNADFMLELFRSWGYDARIETFEVLFPTPKLRRLEMLAPVNFTASLEEPALTEDSTSGQKDEQLPTYNAYSVDGDVTGELVYVNYGVPEDYDELDRLGIDVAGKIVLARYGKSWRGIKPKVAAEKGAIGCILYSDPRGDGYFQGDVYPRGGYRNAAGAQRGSVADMPLYPGDPLTPGVGATPDAERLSIDEAPTLTKIPVLPISYGDAQPLLEALGGPVAPAEWRGALPLTYHVGPGPTKVRLQLEFDWKMATARDVIAMLPGEDFPDQWILRGNHHDAWVNGAADPVSGLVAMLEEARAVAALTKDDWRPRRTIVYAAWDAEEPGLIGSVEWAETHADELRQKAVAYINTDGNSRGFLEMGGSHTLERFMNQVAGDVRDPQLDISVAERLRASILVQGDDEARKEARERADLRLSALGSGSDYTPFFQHLGIASLNLSFGGEADYGQYHSAYDSFDHFKRFMDPGFVYGVALARTAGRATLRLAEAEVLPFRFGTLVQTVTEYVEELEKLADGMRDQTTEQNRLIREGRYTAAADPTKTYVPPSAEDPVPHLNFAPLKNVLEVLRERAQAYEDHLRAESAEGMPVSPDQAAALNPILMGIERSLGRGEGLPGREWFTHFVYAPGFYTGYGVKTLPGVREAIELRQWREAGEQIEVAAAVMEALVATVEQAQQAVGYAPSPIKTKADQ